MKKSTRRVLAALMTAAMAFSMTACTTASKPSGGDASGSGSAAGGETKDIKDIVVGLSIGNTTEERWNREIEMFEAYAKDKGFELKVQNANNDANFPVRKPYQPGR